MTKPSTITALIAAGEALRKAAEAAAPNTVAEERKIRQELWSAIAAWNEAAKAARKGKSK